MSNRHYGEQADIDLIFVPPEVYVVDSCCASVAIVAFTDFHCEKDNARVSEARYISIFRNS